MADRRISDLNPAPSTVDDSNTLFAVEQARTAYRLDGHSFILALTTILDGHGGISDIEYTAPSTGSVDGTLTITMADHTTSTFTVKNGKGISSITQYWAVSTSSSTVPSSWSTTRQTLTATNKYLWSYFAFAMNDGTTAETPKSVVGVYGDQGDTWYMWIRYSGRRPISDSDIGTDPDEWIGIYSGTSSTAPTSYTAYSWYQYKGEKGDTGEASEVTSQSVTYMESASGTVVPSGSWTPTVPSVTPGNFLWTKTEIVFNGNTSNPLVMYSVSRFGIDGSGSVSSVNNVSPDPIGNVAITATGIPTSDSTSVQAHIDDLESDIDELESNIDANNAGSHNGIYRGKNLGTFVTAEQYAQISAGTFEDLYIGDYWEIDGVNWRIAAFDYWLDCGDTECTTHHVVIVPDSNLDSQKMNDTNVTTGAYVGSKMYASGLDQAKTTINSAFGAAHILSHRNYLKNAVTNSYESAAAWYASTVELMTEQNVYGGIIFSNNTAGTTLATRHTIDKTQFPLFALDPRRICNRANWWLRDVASSTTFAHMYSYGHAGASGASNSLGVRPAFGIKA